MIGNHLNLKKFYKTNVNKLKKELELENLESNLETIQSEFNKGDKNKGIEAASALNNLFL